MRHQRLVEALKNTWIPFVDLRPEFLGVRGAYRMIDSHWTERGVAIAADRVLRLLEEIMPH